MQEPSEHAGAPGLIAAPRGNEVSGPITDVVAYRSGRGEKFGLVAALGSARCTRRPDLRK